MEKRVGLLKQGLQLLFKEGVTNPQGEAEIFLSYVLNCPRIELYLDNLAVEEKDARQYRDLLTKRREGVPLQYLVGSTEFMGLEFKVAPGVFIPRPETEILVETVIEILTNKLTNKQTDKLVILDIGTGCGNIAISIAKYLKKAHIFACDISDSALQLTKENSRFNRVRTCLVKSNLFCAFKKKNYFSLIVSNPPYIEAQEIPGLSRELQYEPRLALDGDKDGLFYYRRIVNESVAYLEDKAMLVLEIGDNQAIAVKEIIAQSRRFSMLKTVKDYNDVERVIVAQKIK